MFVCPVTNASLYEVELTKTNFSLTLNPLNFQIVAHISLQLDNLSIDTIINESQININNNKKKKKVIHVAV